MACPMPTGAQNIFYSDTMTGYGSGGTVALAWDLAAGTLPATISLSSAGVASGTPINPGTTTVTLRVTDTNSVSTTLAGCSITINAGAAALPPSAVFGGVVSSGTTQ